MISSSDINDKRYINVLIMYIITTFYSLFVSWYFKTDNSNNK